ncbi:MAG TPA: hypothetical protein VKU41_06475 [Polyangiaceae bacterium]|nr:hypothetical protein [Polyangiaceae bacterium]
MVVLLCAALVPGGCSSSSSGSPCGACATGNECIDDGSGSGPQCHKVCTDQSGCPAGWSCHEGQASGQTKSWCLQDWHVSCSPRVADAGTSANTETDNPACDTAKGFGCYAHSPTDANAFCTKFTCAKDSDCPGGWWCATVNQAPNATTGTASLGQTRNVCTPRTYCSPCTSDADCNWAPDNTPTRCVQTPGGERYCSPQCANNTDCALDATCSVQETICSPAAGSACKSDADCPPANGTFQHCDGGHCTPECGGASDCDAGQTCAARGLCAPQAGTCKGDGSFCSPCRSDADCSNGYCFSGAPYSTERFCTVKSTAAKCTSAATNPPGCPAHQSGDNWKVTQCTVTPPDQCVAEVSFGMATGTTTTIFVPGCWTQNR